MESNFVVTFYFAIGTHISNTREAKAFALMSEENIGEGKRRIFAVTADYAFRAINSAVSLEKEINEASKAEKNALAEVGLQDFIVFVNQNYGIVMANRSRSTGRIIELERGEGEAQRFGRQENANKS